MSASSQEIRIDDLVAPILTPLQQGAMEAAAGLEPDLSEEAVLSEAARATGLDDFGAEDFRERLRVQIESIREDAELGPVGRIGVYRDLVRYASNRPRFEDLLKRHPEILDVEIRRPIIIAGLPRSGTTHLLNLIAADSRLRSLPYWESLEPIPDPREEADAGGVDPRLVRCREAYAQQVAMMPLLKNMHDMAPDHVHEEIELQALDFSSYLLEWIVTPRAGEIIISVTTRPRITPI